MAAGVDNHFQVSIVGHDMTVISSDFVPVNAFTTDSLFIGVGQRYDVTIEAKEEIDNYWFNVTFGGGNLCGASRTPYPAAILHYDGASDDLPTNKGTRPRDHNCLDLLELTPVVERKVSAAFTPTADNTMEVQLPTGPKFVWKINGKAIRTEWENPVAQYIAANRTDYPETNSIWGVEAVDQVSPLLIPKLSCLCVDADMSTSGFTGSSRTTQKELSVSRIRFIFT